MGLFKQQRNDEYYFDKQLSETKENLVLGNATDPQQELVQLEQRREREDLVRWQQDLGDDMACLVHDLKREQYNSEEGCWEQIMVSVFGEDGKIVRVPSEPMCNDLCIQMIIATIRPFMSKNEIMSNYSENRILQKLRSTLKTLVRNIGIKYDYYEVDFHDISSIRTTLQNYMMSAPYRALNNGERRHLESSTRRIETVNLAEKAQQGGLRGMFYNK